MCICETFRSWPVRYGTLLGPLLLTLPHPDMVPRVPAPTTPSPCTGPISHASTARISPAAQPPPLSSPDPHHTFILSLHKFLPLYQRNCNQTSQAPSAVTCSKYPLTPVRINAQCRLAPLQVERHFWYLRKPD